MFSFKITGLDEVLSNLNDLKILLSNMDLKFKSQIEEDEDIQELVRSETSAFLGEYLQDSSRLHKDTQDPKKLQNDLKNRILDRLSKRSNLDLIEKEIDNKGGSI